MADSVERIMDKAVSALKSVRGIRAIMLGGSRARGTHRPDSDIDIGIYYTGDGELDLAALESAAEELDDERRKNLIAPPGAWGPWVDGGAWLTVGGLPVDFIFRNVGRVAAVIRECRGGIVYANYQPGHPHAFINAMYMGELAIGKLLWESGGEISALKAEAEIYSDALRSACIRNFLFEAEFSSMLAGKSAGSGDVYYVAAHATRSISCLNQVLFALNREYCLNEKGAVRLAENFAVRPESYGRRVEEIVACLGGDVRQACALLDGLVRDVQRLAV